MSRVGTKHVVGPRFGGMGLSPSAAKAMNRIARRLDDVTRETFTYRDEHERRGGGFAVKLVQVQGYAAGNTRFRVRDWNSATQSPIGNEYEVFAYSYGQTAGQVGAVNLGQVLPLYQSGDIIRIIRMQAVTSGAKEWATLDSFVRSCAATGGGALTDGGNSEPPTLPAPTEIGGVHAEG